MRLWAEERNGGCTVIQNSRITLSGDNGRRICYQLSALKGNTLDVSLGYGIASTKEVSGNTIRGRIRHKVFQDCSGVENNNVEVRRFSILGWTAHKKEVLSCEENLLRRSHRGFWP